MAGFTDSDGYFGVKTVSPKPKSETRKRSVSASVNLVFKIEQRSFDRPTSTSMLPIMEKIGDFLYCNIITNKKNPTVPLKLEPIDTLSASVTSLDKIEPVIDYFNKYPILGVKGLDFKDWEVVYYMIKSKEHLTESGRLKIELIKSNMNSKRVI